MTFADRIETDIERELIRKRKTAHRRAKKLNTTRSWDKFRKIRNKETKYIRQSKQCCFDQLYKNLKSETVSFKD